MGFLRDKFTLGCITAIVIATIAAVSALIVSGHSQETFRVMSLVGAGVINLCVLLGVANKVQKVGDTAEVAHVEAKQAVTDLKNGVLKDKVKEALIEMEEERAKGMNP
jgi:hypothetical protein